MSITKVASHAGVSKSTVSLVINDSPLVLPSTADKVRLSMQAIGYVPSPRELRRGRKPNGSLKNRSLNIALVTLGIPAAVLRAPLYCDVLHGIGNAIREHRHRFTVFNAPNAREFSAEEILSSGADGFLLFGRGEPTESSHAFREFPCVALMGVDAPRKWCDWVGYDDAVVGQLAAAHALRRGHLNCAYFGLPEWRRGQMFGEMIRAAGGQVTMFDSAGLIVSRDDIHEVENVAMDALVEKLLSTTPRPTAVFVWADMLTAALYPRLQVRGIQPGKDISIISCNKEWPLLFGLQPQPAVVDVQGVKIGYRSVQQLLWRMHNRKESRVVMLLEPVLIPDQQP